MDFTKFRVARLEGSRSVLLKHQVDAGMVFIVVVIKGLTGFIQVDTAENAFRVVT